MKIQSKILLLKSRASNQMACSAVASAGSFYWRPIASTDAINAALETENFQLVVLDHRSADSDGISAIASLRKLQPNAKVILVSDPLELHDVVQAMRIGVREVFPPPLEMQGILKCIESNLDIDWSSADPDRWSVLLEFLEVESPAHTQPSKPAPRKAREVSSQADAHAAAHEVEASTKARRQLEELTTECKRLAQEVTRLSAVEAHALSLEKELEAVARKGGPRKDDDARAADRERIKKMEADATGLESALNAERAKFAKLKADFDAERGQHEQLQKSIEELKQSLADAEKRASEAAAERDVSKKQGDDRRAHTTKEVAALTREKANLLTELARIQEEDEAHVAELEEATKKIETLQHQISGLEATAQRLVDAEARLSALEKEYQALRLEKESFAERDASRAALEAKLQAENRRGAELARELQSTKAEAGKAILEAEAKLEAVNKAIVIERASIAEREKALAADRAQHEATCSQVDEQLSQREAALATRDHELQTALTRLHADQKAHENALREHQEKESKLSEIETGILEDRRILDEKLAAASHQLSEYTAKLAEVESRDTRLAETEKQLTVERQNLSAKEEALKAEAESLAEDRASLQKIRETLSTERARLESSMKELETGRADLSDRVTRFEQKRDELAEEMKRFLAAC